ncbi:hypothetical protein M8C21_033603 [Ambrosia artemisiifolia]|uniref:Uncharacterized protein n=1 Tax=Ambrosia artemisiifolia TaxID=4212 RepID=A0AAD5GKQ7_AMBAR|nr:hypothetical protein M8C21_033603 [Ambrosia artemisiifolia]
MGTGNGPRFNHLCCLLSRYGPRLSVNLLLRRGALDNFLKQICRNHGAFVWKKKTGRWVPTLPRIVAMCGDEVVDALLMFLRRFRTTGMWLELLLRPDIDDSVWFRLHSRVFVCRNMSVDTNAFERQCIHYLGLQRARTPPPPVGRKVLR